MAMDTEEMLKSLPFDAVVLIGGCDKTVPARVMGALSAVSVCTAGDRSDEHGQFPRPAGRGLPTVAGWAITGRMIGCGGNC